MERVRRERLPKRPDPECAPGSAGRPEVTAQGGCIKRVAIIVNPDTAFVLEFNREVAAALHCSE
jgi:hypothetical protein